MTTQNSKHPWPTGTVVRDHNDKRLGIVKRILSDAPDDCSYVVQFTKRGCVDPEPRHQDGLEWVRPRSLAFLW